MRGLEANALATGSPKVDYVIAGLVNRRAHVAGKIERPHEYLRKLLADLESLGAHRLVQQGPRTMCGGQ